jgi:predicted  nucleic acid-binding Zn-ribbon protein
VASFLPRRSETALSDVDLLVRLSRVHVDLHRNRGLPKAIVALEREAEELRANLSLVAGRVLEVLLQKKRLPIVASLEAGACGECHLFLPTALASSVSTSQTLHQCLHCKRILVARGLDAADASSASAGR